MKNLISLLLADKLDKPMPLPEISGKVVLITGASKGVGKATVDYLLAEGCAVVAFSRNTLEFDDSTNLLKLKGDIRNLADCKNAIENTVTKFGKIDVLVNCAGINTEKPLDEVTSEDIDKIIDTNVKGAINMSSAVTSQMKKQKYGTIINIGSKISHNTNVKPDKVLYAASKYALEGMSFALNKELKSYGIRVVCLMPGTINTFVSIDAANYLAPTRVAQLIGMIIKFDDVDFEGLVVKSKYQNI